MQQQQKSSKYDDNLPWMIDSSWRMVLKEVMFDFSVWSFRGYSINK